MKQEFTVKAKSFALYKAFKEEVEALGYFYEQGFSRFEEKELLNTNCLYFTDEFDINNPKINSFAFSNSIGDVIDFNLPQDWEEALNFAKTNFKINKTEGKKLFTIAFERALQILADHFEVDVEDIAIIE